MSSRVPIEILLRLGARAIVAANRRVARRFVPDYASTTAIRLVAADARRVLASRLAIRLIKPPRAVS
jgi:hypothetical protein